MTKVKLNLLITILIASLSIIAICTGFYIKSYLETASIIENGLYIDDVNVDELTSAVPELLLPTEPILQINDFHYYSSRDTFCYIVFDIDSVYYNDFVTQVTQHYKLSSEQPHISAYELEIDNYRCMYKMWYDDDYIRLFEYPVSESKVQFILCYDGFNQNLDRYIRLQIKKGNIH